MQQNIRKHLILSILALSGKPVSTQLKCARTFQYLDISDTNDYHLQKIKGLLEHFESYGLLELPHNMRWQQFDTARELLNHLPLMDKSRLATIYQHLKDNRFPSGQDVVKRTSGSSGNPMSLVKNNQGLACELAATWNSYEWAGIKIGDRGFRIWGRPFSRWQRIKQAIPDLILNRRRLSAFNLTEVIIRSHLDKIKRKRPVYIYGYTSIIRELAQFLLDTGQKPPKELRAIITTAEPLDSDSKRTIEQGFGIRCYNEYGCTEVGSIAHECEYGSLHIMANNLIVEVINLQGESVIDEEGEIVITDLTNKSMPVIRYRVGDFGLITNSPCKCGRTLPIITAIHGRIEDLLITPDKKIHHPASICYIVDIANEEHDLIKQYKVIQHSPSHFELIVVPSKDTSDAELSELKNSFQINLQRNLHPDTRASITLVKDISRESSGKYRIVERKFPLTNYITTPTLHN